MEKVIIEIETPNNNAKEELEVYQQILNIDGEECPFRIVDIKAHFSFYGDYGYRRSESENDTQTKEEVHQFLKA